MLVTHGDLQHIFVDKYFDSENAIIVNSPTVLLVSSTTGLIHDVKTVQSFPPASPTTIDLRGRTVLPGLVDTHVHFFLHPYSETPWEDQVTKESVVERTVRAVSHARRTLMAGFTTVRDLGTEGAEDSDTALRSCLSSSKQLMIGPRYFISNKAIVSSGSYGPRSSVRPSQAGVDNIHGAQIADGPEECVRVVRQQIGAGADWIKFYADYGARIWMAPVAQRVAMKSVLLFTQTEMAAIVETAHQRGVKVAAHGNDNKAIASAAQASIDTLEHGYNMDEETLRSLRDNGIIWNPTLSAYFTHRVGSSRWDLCQATFRRALALGGLKIACGGDTGVFPHGDNALELQLMAKLGMPWLKVLQSTTIRGWECVRSMEWEGPTGQDRLHRIAQLGEDLRDVGENEMPFGVLRKGFSADIIATSVPLDQELSALCSGNIEFVMKCGRVFKINSGEVHPY